MLSFTSQHVKRIYGSCSPVTAMFQLPQMARQPFIMDVPFHLKYQAQVFAGVDSVQLCEFKVLMRNHLSSLFLWIVDIYLVQLGLFCLLIDLTQWQLVVRGVQARAIRNPHPNKGPSYHDSHFRVGQPCHTAFSNASFSQINDIVTIVCNQYNSITELVYQVWRRTVSF